MASTHISHACSPAKALYTIFVQPAISTPPRTLVRPQHLNRLRPQQSVPHTRSFALSSRLQAGPGKKTARGPEVRDQKWNEEITARLLQLVDPETKKLGEPTTRFDVLKNLDMKTHRLVQLTPDDPTDRNFVPVCKIVSKKESYEADKKKKEQQKDAKRDAAKERSVKTLELNWAIDSNDLGHRLEKVRSFLEEGRRVEVVLASKKKGRKASREECEEVLGRIRGVVEAVNGAKETSKGLEGKVGGFATLVFQGKAGVVTAGAKEEAKVTEG